MTVKKLHVEFHKKQKRRLKASKKKLKTLQNYAQYNIDLIVNYFGKENTKVLVANQTDSCYIEVYGLLRIRMSDHSQTRRRRRIRNKPTICYESDIRLSEKKLESDVERAMQRYEGTL